LGANLWNFYNQHNPGRISVLDGGKHAHMHSFPRHSQCAYESG
jgi:hypothetical protein